METRFDFDLYSWLFGVRVVVNKGVYGSEIHAVFGFGPFKFTIYTYWLNGKEV